MTRGPLASGIVDKMKSVHLLELQSTMTLSPNTQSPSGTETAWPKKGSLPKRSANTSAKNSKTGASKSNRNLDLGKTSKSPLVFSFGAGKAEGSETQKALLGGKGANLHGMTKLGLPVPPGFTVSTEVCTY